MPIPEIFRRYGEARFRDIETQVVREIAPRNGLVIATGGGAVLREENVDLLRQNGRLFFLERDPGLLVPTDDRPLADSREKMDALYQKRLPVYRAAADECVNTGDTPGETPEKTAEEIMRRILP